MGTIYRKIPLSVTAEFMPDGSVTPKGLTLNKTNFPIDKVLSSAARAPRAVSSVDPIEYTVMIRGREKKIYYEVVSNTWFSVKEVRT